MSDKVNYEYTSIACLKGPDRVRKRPVVMFGSDGIEGIIAAFKQVFKVFVSEILMGKTNCISTTIHNDSSISIKSMNSGLIIDETEIAGKPAWHYMFCELYSGMMYSDRNSNLYGHKETDLPKYNEYMYFDDIGLAVTQYVSEYMNLTVVRDGVKRILNFKEGFPCSDLHKEKSDEKSYTHIHFKPDPRVFKDTNISINDFTEILTDYTITIQGLKCELRDMRNGKTLTYCYENGIEERCRELIPQNITTPIYTKTIEATGRDRYNFREYDAISKVAIAFTSGKQLEECYHNYRTLKFGGIHLKKLKRKIIDYFSWTLSLDLNKYKVGVEDDDFFYDALLGNTIIILETACSGPSTSKWENGTRESIINKMISDMSEDLIGKEFECFLETNKEQILKIFDNFKE